MVRLDTLAVRLDQNVLGNNPLGWLTLVLFRTRHRDECWRRREGGGSRSKKPSEGSRWRGGRGTYANWMERGRGVEVSGSGQGRWSSSRRTCAKASRWVK